MAHSTGILDLPVELLLLIFSDLDVTSFLHLTSTCRALHAPNILLEPSYWSNVVRTTFRVPNQPVLAHDGLRWKNLYKRMLMQNRVYLWGNNDKGSLAVAPPVIRIAGTSFAGGPARITGTRHLRAARPEPMLGVEGLGIVSDLQCGGWSNTILTHKGALYTTGVIDGLLRQKPEESPTPLLYPPGFASPLDRYEPSTAIKQFSAGRCHILGLSDSGRIWSWHDATRAALHVKFLHHDVVENGKARGRGVVEKVMAGWNRSAAFIHGTGIVLWNPLQRDNDDTSFADAALVMQSELVPHTSFQVNPGKTATSGAEDDATAAEIGEVCNFVVLERFVLFNTHLGKAYVFPLLWEGPVPVELPVPHDEGEDGENPAFVTDIQGSFRSFAVFTKSGAVLTGMENELVDYCGGALGDRPLFSRIPALQHNAVIQVAFGDYHFHALHAPGYITSYGEEPQQCGAFGLGDFSGVGLLRGLIDHGAFNARLVPHAYAKGRRIWFQKEKEAWLKFLDYGGVDEDESQERRHTMRLFAAAGGNQTERNLQWQGELSEWIEQEGDNWGNKLGVQHDDDDDGLGSHFALSVAAAGWHSGALVLVNDDLEKRIEAACAIPDPALPVQPNDNTHPDSGSSFVESAISAATDYGRRFLGLPPVNGFPQQNLPVRNDRLAIHLATAPRPGMRYVWSRDNFPRLVLSDGREMPGTVPFVEWRYGRPEWDLTQRFTFD